MKVLLTIFFVAMTNSDNCNCKYELWQCRKTCSDKHEIGEEWLYCYDQCGTEFLRCKKRCP